MLIIAPPSRFERTSILQQSGFLNREELHSADLKALQQDSKNAKAGFFKSGRWIWAHDAEKYAEENYMKCL
jgi:two-component SAPR family response regulator